MMLRRALPFLLLAVPAMAQQHALDVPRGDPDRRPLLDAIRPTLMRLTDGPVHFGVRELRRFGDFAFGILEPRRPERQPIDWSQTSLRGRVAEPGFEDGLTQVLWRRLPGGWKVEQYAIAPATPAWPAWQRQYSLPRVLFEAGVTE
ncbi:hypothetical protein [Roseococcus sp. YIM B11640]|uniref:hypothetical protein n=1 Tax=Roseococcus sp. YIM B11640 TaxID=3133973 RepID=UPI003C7ED493